MPIIIGGDEDDFELWITVDCGDQRIGSFRLQKTRINELLWWCEERWGPESPSGGFKNAPGWSMWGSLLFLPLDAEITEFKLTWL